MNRVLKFRAWDGERMRYDVTGFEHGKENEMHGVLLDGKYFSIVPRRLTLAPTCAAVMQFTGLTDSNGTDLYEGDVVYLAGYGDYECIFPFIELYEAAAEQDIGQLKGNRWENPDLVQGVKE